MKILNHYAIQLNVIEYYKSTTSQPNFFIICLDNVCINFITVSLS